MAYRLYALALAGQPRAGANRVLAEALDDAANAARARAAWGAALALTNDPAARRDRVCRAALAVTRPAATGTSTGAARCATRQRPSVLLKESGLLAGPAGAAAGRAPAGGGPRQSDALSTQEQAWADRRRGALLGPRRPPGSDRAGRPGAAVGGGHDRQRRHCTGPATARNLDAPHPCGRPSPPPAVPVEPARRRTGRNARFSRQVLHARAATRSTSTTLRQNTGFVLLIEGRADDGQEHTAQCCCRACRPGWEIAGRLRVRDRSRAWAWLGELSDTEAQPAADDRYRRERCGLTKECARLPRRRPSARRDARPVRAAGRRARGHVSARRLCAPGDGAAAS